MDVTDVKTGPASPSAVLVNAATAPVEVRDASGRRIGIRKLGLLDRLRLIEGLGAAAENATYLNCALMLASVVSINGEVEAQAVTKKDIEVMASRLDNDGFEAVVEGYNANFKKPESGNPDDIKK